MEKIKLNLSKYEIKVLNKQFDLILIEIEFAYLNDKNFMYTSIKGN